MISSSVISRQRNAESKRNKEPVSAHRISESNLPVCLRWQVSKMSAMGPGPQSDVQTFTIGVLPQIPGFPQLAPDCDLQISVRDQSTLKVTFFIHANPCPVTREASAAVDLLLEPFYLCSDPSGWRLFVSLQALEDRVTEITPSALSFIDSETPSEKLMYNITKALPPGQGVQTPNSS